MSTKSPSDNIDVRVFEEWYREVHKRLGAMSDEQFNAIMKRLDAIEKRVTPKAMDAVCVPDALPGIDRKVKAIAKIVAEHFELNPRWLFVTSRRLELIWPRQIFHALLTESLGAVSITKRAVGKDSRAVYNNRERVKQRCVTEPKYRAEFQALQQKVANKLSEQQSNKIALRPNPQRAE